MRAGLVDSDCVSLNDGMKRLLLLVSLLLTVPAQAGNLGAADEVMFGVDAKAPDYSQTSFKVQVGHMSGPNMPKSVASFSNGLFTIETPPKWVKKLQRKGRIDPDAEMDESGISSSQVISFDYHVQSPNIVYSLLYRDSEGDIQLASWSFLWAEDKAKAFKKAFLDWMTTTESSVHSQLP